jgi:hypothetical protein
MSKEPKPTLSRVFIDMANLAVARGLSLMFQDGEDAEVSLVTAKPSCEQYSAFRIWRRACTFLLNVWLCCEVFPTVLLRSEGQIRTQPCLC